MHEIQWLTWTSRSSSGTSWHLSEGVTASSSGPCFSEQTGMEAEEEHGLTIALPVWLTGI